ncbi:MAG: glycosyltransferase family 4 protein [Lachnospiraceae bacterium]|nr:glycosyltransferase family 4 protein [Lachnospiraceae bacterium]
MVITFVSNYINHHQAPFSDRMYELCGHDYYFIQTEPMEEERVRLGWNTEYINRPYVKLWYKERERCEKLIMDSDCVIFGGCEDTDIVMPRLEAGKLTLVYSERIYKEGRWKFISPRGLKKKYHDHVRFNKYPVFLLCSGAYVKGDFDLIGAYRGKKFKFGYFPVTETYEDPDALRRDNKRVEILWVARFIPLKHPEMMIKLAEDLDKLGKDFHITMTGDGEMREEIMRQAETKGLSDRFTFTGNIPSDEVRERMLAADIFVFTSNRLEGWGAVVNEAMNSGCLTVAPRAVGAVPYLIKDGVNGLIFKTGNSADLTKKVLKGFDPEFRGKLGREAYKTITTLWNANTAAERVYEFAASGGAKRPDYPEGPMSEA